MLLFEKDFYKQIDYLMVYAMFCNMASTINSGYIYDMLYDEDNRVVLYGIDNQMVDLKNCPCALIYNLKKEDDVLEVYIMLISTSYRFRKYGYASLLIKEFIEHIQNKYKSKFEHIHIILDSMEEVVSFYEHIGFHWTLEPKYKDMFQYNIIGYEPIVMIRKL